MRANDLLADVRWQCAPVPTGAVAGPAALTSARLDWLPAVVPGTAAAARREAGCSDANDRDYDTEEWWYSSYVPGVPPGASLRLEAAKLATMADIYWNGALVGRSESDFLASTARFEGRSDGADNELCIRFGSLQAALAGRRSRPRWKTYLVAHQNMRYIRASLLGRLPGWAKSPPAIGPVGPVRLFEEREAALLRAHVTARTDGPTGSGRGVVDVTLSYWPGVEVERAEISLDSMRLECAGTSTRLSIDPDLRAVDRAGERTEAVTMTAQLLLEGIDLWWPRTHGAQPLYRVLLHSDEGSVELARVGFRTVEVDEENGGFALQVNGVPIFCRGATWFPPDPLKPVCDEVSLRSAMSDVVDANMNMLRVPAVSGYEEELFFELCDEMGILVWQECPFAFFDIPTDEPFTKLATAEVSSAFSRLGSHPSLAVICGGQQTEEIPAMNGLAPERYAQPFLTGTVADLAAGLAPQAVYVSSEPSGGALPMQMNTGVSQYFGVGGYLRGIEDVRRSQVRFAAECLALSIPPSAAVVSELGGAHLAGHDPRWKLGVHHDAGRSWDMEDVRDFYVRECFGVDPLLARYTDPEHSLELGRAVSAALMEAVFSEWRRPGSPCGGGLVLGLRDLRPGAGFGLVDSAGWRKAPWYVLRRIFDPVAVLVTDEGLNGLAIHVNNDTDRVVSGALTVSLYTRGALRVEQSERELTVGARSSETVETAAVLHGFRDVSYAFRFAPPAYDVVSVAFCGRELIYLPLGEPRQREEDVGLSASACEKQHGCWEITVSTERFAQWVHFELDAPGRLSNDWFHLLPDRPAQVLWEPTRSRSSSGSSDMALPRAPSGSVHAINAVRAAPVRADPTRSDAS